MGRSQTMIVTITGSTFHSTQTVTLNQPCDRPVEYPTLGYTEWVGGKRYEGSGSYESKNTATISLQLFVLSCSTTLKFRVKFTLIWLAKNFPFFVAHEDSPTSSIANQMEPFTSPCLISLRHILIISFNVRPGIRNGLFFYFFSSEINIYLCHILDQISLAN